ncbi:MAG: VOC family protein [Actinobacteria bacterium]|nr:VOC family protein [Actinomycetota bacterium]
MDQHVNFVTLATADLDAARRFYCDGLGWTPLMDVPDEILFFQIAPGLLLGLFDADKFNQDLATGEDRSKVSGVTLAHNVDSPEAVRDIVSAMADAGARVLKHPQPGAFGGIFHAHVEDPNGVIWEIAHNPGLAIAADGTVSLS